MAVQILRGDCREVLRTLPDDSVHCCVTSPPYFGLRDYGVDGQIGLEPTPDQFIAELVAVFAEVRRILRPDGTLWLNLGDSYQNAKGQSGGVDPKQPARRHLRTARPQDRTIPGLKPKDLIGVPWMAAFALRADGWYLREDIIWSKPNPMPESVQDRCTRSHEYLFHFSKSRVYHHDADAIAEDAIYTGLANQDENGFKDPRSFKGKHKDGYRTPDKQRGHSRRHAGFNDRWDAMERAEQCSGKRNKRSVWNVATQGYSEAHFATFPPALIEPCIKAGTSGGGCCARCGNPWKRGTTKIASSLGQTSNRQWSSESVDGFVPSCACSISGDGGRDDFGPPPAVPCTVLDPFGGAGTTGMVADRLGRNAILIELNPEYAALAERRITNDAGMFANVAAE